MARRNKKPPINTKAIRVVCILIAIGGLGFFLTQTSRKVLKESKLFTVKQVVVPPAIDFVETSYVRTLKGKNIFDVDIERIEKHLRDQFPQISRIRVSKQYPDTIYIMAKKRDAFAQAKIKNRNVTIDSEGFVLSNGGDRDENLPAISGLKMTRGQIQPGFPLTARHMNVALKIIRAAKTNTALAVYPVSRVDMDNPSAIDLYLEDNLRILLDKEQVEQKMNILGLLLSQQRLDFDEIKYVDLRFKEPIIRKK